MGTISVRFTLDEFGSDPGGAVHRRRSSVLMDIEASGEEVVELVAVQIDEDGGLVSWTRWRAGQERLLRWNASSRRIDGLPLPAPPNVTAVLADTFGPMGDPAEHGYRKIGNDSYEVEEGLGVFRLSFPDDLDRRVFEAVDPDDEQVMSRISGIHVGDSPAITPEILEMMATVPTRARIAFLRPEGP
ncbi:hypothetical protein ETD86_15200 [Nonomuraea turkmeniaca]|uniref:Uncharacterized protein n=1 Tax=Nonomuraea turkmeniaca TaxID=103838 RepID=A0A5S4FLB2_9ACTN|nr:hypothetical protein [Nonomuraea turkmeniaca]TMR21516.1 hypothetical protein ETD86_15200 [Nonomuraea turkmeniaca]